MFPLLFERGAGIFGAGGESSYEESGSRFLLSLTNMTAQQIAIRSQYATSPNEPNLSQIAPNKNAQRPFGRVSCG
jgi:hypothetical protein